MGETMSLTFGRACLDRPALSLTLLVSRILADDPHDAFAPNDLAVPANPLHRCLYSHRPLRHGHDPNDPALL